ncbi:MAG: amidohydrolase family protein [Victivallales bacterium]|nr:amidohydrolase family protein [Victivallales bacterium]
MDYFSTAVTIGWSDYAPVFYQTAERLLAHMDYLGIDRCLVNTYGVPSIANREILEVTKAHAGRLYPAFWLYPGIFYERGGMEFLIKQAQLGNKAYRVATGPYRLRECERMLQQLAVYRPVIFVDSDCPDAFLLQDIEELAGKYPDLYFVVGKMIWSRYIHLLDLMWRRKNVGIEISWLHVRDAIETVIEQFGVERLFFGISHESQAGAAVGNLAQAQITDAQRQAIAHGNLERLLGVAPLKTKLANEPDFADKPLWKRFKEGGKLDQVRIYDVHAHLTGPTSMGWIHREHTHEQAMQEIIAFMDRYGVDKMVLTHLDKGMQGNQELEKVTAPYPGRFLGNFVYNPKLAEEYNETIMDEFFGRGFFVGFKLLAAYWKIPYSDPSYTPVWEYAEKHHLPILMHTSSDVKDLMGIPEKYPHAKFILGHSGLSDTGRLQAYQLAERSENVYFEFCGTFVSTISWKEGIERFGNHRFVFGSDTAHHSEAYELSGFLSIPLPDEILKPILSDNYQRMLDDRV